MARQTIKRGQLLTLTAADDDILLLGPYLLSESVVRFINVSGTSKFTIGGPVASDTNLANVTGAGSTVTFTVSMIRQADPDPSSNIHRVWGAGVGTWRVEW